MIKKMWEVTKYCLKRCDNCQNFASKDVTTDKIFPQKMPHHNKWQTQTGDGGVHSEQPATGCKFKRIKKTHQKNAN